MPKYLSGRAKITPQSKLSDDRYKYLDLGSAEPNLGNPPVGGSPSIPSGDQYQVISVLGDDNEINRYWIPIGGGVIPGSISIFEEGSLVGTANSITQLNFIGNSITAIAAPYTPGVTAGTIATMTVAPPGNNNEVLFKSSGDFATSSNLLFNTTAGILTSKVALNIGIGGTILTAYSGTSSGVGVASVGIGTTNPSRALHVRGDLRLTGTIYDGDNYGGGTGNLLVKASDGSVEWKQPENVQAGAGGTVSEIQYHDDTGLLDGAPNFVWIESTQRVGIGSTQPRTLLDVVGIASFSDIEVSGVSTFVGLTTFRDDITVSGVSTFEQLTQKRLVYIGAGSTLVDNANLTFNGTGLNVIGLVTTTNLNVTGVATAGYVEIGGDDDYTIKTTSGNLKFASTGGTIRAENKFSIIDTTEVSDYTTGALQVNGGGHFDKSLLVGGGLSVVGGAGTSVSPIGVGVTLCSARGITTTGGDLYVGGDLYIRDDLTLDEGNFQRLIVNPGISTFVGIATFHDKVWFNKDVEFFGQTAGITSAFWDQSEGRLKFKDDVEAVFGTGDDLIIYHTTATGSTGGSIIRHTTDHDMRLQIPAGSHDIVLETTDDVNMATFHGDAGVQLYWRGASNRGIKFETTATGTGVTGGHGDDGATHDGDVTFTGNNYDLLWDKSQDSLEFKDETQLTFGNNRDLQISHTNSLASQNDSNGDSIVDGWTSYIHENGTGALVFKTDGGPGEGAYQFFDTAWRPLLKLFSGTSARAALYHAGIERLVTKYGGIDITGNAGIGSLTVTGVSTFLGPVHDKDGDAGINGQLLQTTGSAVDWVSGSDLTVRNSDRVGVGSTSIDGKNDTSLPGIGTYYMSFVEDANPYDNRSNEYLYTSNSFAYDVRQRRVGVGTSAPRHDLDVVGHTTTTQLSVSGESTFYGNVDVVGVVTARKGVRINSEGLSVTGVSTFGGNLVPASNEGSNIGVSSSFRFNNVYAKKFHGEFEGLIDGVDISKYSSSFTASAGVAVGIDTFVKNTYDNAEYTIYFSNGGNIQSQKLLVMDDNTSVFSNEYAVMYNTSQIVDISAVVDGSNIKINATPVTGVSGNTTYSYIRIIL